MKSESDFLQDFDDATSIQTVSEPIKPRCAMEVDDWGFRRGTQLLEDSERLQALNIPKEAVVTRQERRASKGGGRCSVSAV